MHVLCDVIRFVAVTLTDANCKTEWVLYHDVNYYPPDNELQPVHIASTLTECQKACEFDPRCVAVWFRAYWSHCHLNTNPDREHDSWPISRDVQYHTVIRCNITSGQCNNFDIFLSTRVC